MLADLRPGPGQQRPGHPALAPAGRRPAAAVEAAAAALGAAQWQLLSRPAAGDAATAPECPGVRHRLPVAAHRPALAFAPAATRRAAALAANLAGGAADFGLWPAADRLARRLAGVFCLAVCGAVAAADHQQTGR